MKTIPASRPVSVTKFAKAFARATRSGNATVLAGAGISMVPPSSLPSGDDLRDHVVRTLSKGTGVEAIAKELMHDQRYRNLLPERAFQRIFEAVGVEMHKAFSSLGTSRANVVHSFLSRVAGRGCVVMTTNFDELIQQTDATAKVLHLHGRLSDPTEMIIRIEQVGMGLLPNVSKSFQKATRGRILFIIGYSGRDHDIMCAISSAAPAEVWWLDRSTPAGLSAITALHPVVCCGDLRDVVRRACLLLGMPAPRSSSSSRAPKVPFPITAPLWRRFFCLAKLAGESGQLELSVKACTRMAAKVTRPSDVIYAATQAIICLRELGKLAEARRWLTLGLSAIRGASDEEKAGIYNAQGYMALEEKTPRVRDALIALMRAERHQHRFAASLAAVGRRRDAWVFLGRIHNNIGWAHQVGGQHAAAVAAYRESLRFKRGAGDLPGVAFTTANLARAHHLADDRKSAVRWRARARRLCRNAGMPGQEAYILFEMAEVAAKAGRKRMAARQLSEAEALIAGMEHRQLQRRISQLQSQISHA